MELPFTLRSDPRQGAKMARSSALVAGLLAPALVGFLVGSWSPLLLTGTALGAGVEVLGFSDKGVTITRKRHTKQLAWDEFERADFAGLNTTPWLTLEIRGGERHRLCLEDFTAQAQRAISEAIMAQIPQRTTATESWTIANRIPVSITKRGAEDK